MCEKVLKEESVWIPELRRGYVISKFARNGRKNVSVTPLAEGGVRLTVKADTLEAADELCALCKCEIYRLAERAEEKYGNT